MEESACNLASILPGRVASPSEPLRARERAVDLANQLNKLSDAVPRRDCLPRLQGLSFDEIAEQMGRTSGAVRMLWLRALDQFKVTYEGPQNEDPDA